MIVYVTSNHDTSMINSDTMLIPMATKSSPTDFELSELQAEIDAENESIQNGDDSHRHEIDSMSLSNDNSDANVDDWVDYMLHGLLEDIQYWFLHYT